MNRLNIRSISQVAAQLVSAQDDKDNQILQAIDKLINNEEKVWPEIIRLILKLKLDKGENFGPNTASIEGIIQKWLSFDHF